MKKLSKSSKTVIIAVAVPVVLAAVALILFITLPKANPDVTGVNSFGTDDNEEQVVPINTKNVDDVSFLSVSNENGTFAFTQQKRVIQQDNESGETVNKDEFYWTSEELLNVPQDDSKVRSFITGLAQLSGVSVVEENAEDLDKYGLQNAAATAEARFTDGTSLTMLFGIKNPANEQTVYFRMSDSQKVYLVSYFSVSNVFSDVRKFATLTLTDSHSSGNNEPEYLRISRSDFDLPVEICSILSVEGEKNDEDFEVTTYNTHRFAVPITVEVDSAGRGNGVSGKTLCYGIYGLTMDACENLEKTYDVLKSYGLDNPFARVDFKCGSKEYHLLLSEENTEQKKYYAVMDGVPGIYSISRDNAPWCTFSIENLLPVRPLSPYIYSVDNIEISNGGNVYKFEINSGEKSFTCNGNPINAERFREFYRELIGEFGEDVYLTQVPDEQEPEISVKFTYKNEYWDYYNGESDTVEFFSSDGRKCKVNLNGKTLYKVSDAYVTRLLENISALNNGEEVNTQQ